MPLPLLDAPGKLATTCLLVGHARKANYVWTCAQFVGLVEHLMNDNPSDEFLLAFPRPAGDPREPYAKAKKQRVEKRAAWAWDTITGRAKQPTGIGFYPTNAERKTRWGAMDFDAHDGDAGRARKLALAAFEVLLPHKDLFLVLATSGGGGWHLFALTADFHPVAEWSRLFRQVTEFIGSHVEKGVCEIFPDEGRGRGNAIRCPGTWHPKSNEFSLIAFERIQPLLEVEKREIVPFLDQSTARGKPSFSLLSRHDLRCEQALSRHAITKPATRHQQLVALVAELYRFYSRPVVETLARSQFEKKSVETRADLKTHLHEFADVWDYWLKHYYQSALSHEENEKLQLLRTDEEREAFRLAWGFANIDTAKDFAYSTSHFARNLGLTIPGASKQRDKLCALRVIERTAAFIPNKQAGRFRWIANVPSPGENP